jgi:hypothetical protein
MTEKIHEIGIATSGTGQVFPGEPAANASEIDVLQNKLIKCEIKCQGLKGEVDTLLDALEEKDCQMLLLGREQDEMHTRLRGAETLLKRVFDEMPMPILALGARKFHSDVGAYLKKRSLLDR